MANKGLSPLIAVLILVVIAIGIGAILVGLGKGFYQSQKSTSDEQDESIVCSRDVLIDVLKIDGVPQICKGTSYVYVVLKNIGQKTIDDYSVSVYGLADLVTNYSIIASADSHTKGETQNFNVSFSGLDSLDIYEVRFVPKLKKSGREGYTSCFDAEYKFVGTPDDC